MQINRIEQTRRNLLEQGKKIINLSSGNPSEFGVTFPQKILSKAFLSYQDHPAYDPDPRGSDRARRAVAAFYASRGFDAPPENIILTSGTSESYLHLFKLLAKPGEEILFPLPTYPLFEHIAALADIRLRHYDLDAGHDWQVDLGSLEEKITAKTRAIVLISPNNPTGGVLAGQSLSEVLAIAQRHRLPVISDEVFSEFMFDGQTFPRAATLGRDVTVFTLSGISKTYALPGLKLGWIVMTGPDVSKYRDELELSVDTLLAGNQISQAMLPEIIAGGEKFLQDYRSRVQKSRDTAIKILGSCQHLVFHRAAGGFYLFPEVKNFPGTDEEFVISLMESTGIFVHPGYFYDYEKGLHVLLSLLMEADELAGVLDTLVRTVNLLCVGR